ncbi:MAG: endonuclease Q family protein, partial [Thermodesulfobacteriota bacterium]
MDAHLHSRFSRATSKQLTIENLSKYGKIKGLNIIATGDFTHPIWFKELKEKLKPASQGLYTYENTHFILSTEVSTIYEQDGLTRKIHHILYAPDFETVEEINKTLSKYGSLSIDGRPMFKGLTSPELVEKLMGISNEIVVIPAHAWTPWFSVFGSKSGFDSMKECYQDMEKHIFALETGLSSDPKMNWRLSS